jgi:hypothetical protein
MTKQKLITVLLLALVMGSCCYFPQYFVKSDPKKSRFKVNDRKNKFNLEINGYPSFGWIKNYSFFEVKLENKSSAKLTVFADSMSLRSKHFIYHITFDDEMIATQPHLLTVLSKQEGTIAVAFEVDSLSAPYRIDYPPLDEEVTLKLKIVKNAVDTIDVEAAFAMEKF